MCSQVLRVFPADAARHVAQVIISCSSQVIICRRTDRLTYHFGLTHSLTAADRRQMLTSGQSNLTKGRIAAAHGRFNRNRQGAPVCTPI